jgi:tripartite-type tricarboxylate transporter receptor subunit TctC
MKRVAGTMKILMLSALVVAWLGAGSTVFSSDFYQGKRVSIIVPFGPGVPGPLIAKMFEQLFKGSTPDVVVRLKKIM